MIWASAKNGYCLVQVGLNVNNVEDPLNLTSSSTYVVYLLALFQQRVHRLYSPRCLPAWRI